MLAPAVCASVAVAFWMELRTSPAMSPARRLGSTAIGVIAFCVLLLLPAATRWAWLRLEASSIPITADATMIHRETHVVRFDGVEPFLVGYVTRLSNADLDTFLRSGLDESGWTIDIVSDPEEFPDIYPWLIGTRLKLHTHGVRLRQDGPSVGVRLQQAFTIHRCQRYAQVCVCDAGTERWVYANAWNDTAPRWVHKLGL